MPGRSPSHRSRRVRGPGRHSGTGKRASCETLGGIGIGVALLVFVFWHRSWASAPMPTCDLSTSHPGYLFAPDTGVEDKLDHVRRVLYVAERLRRIPLMGSYPAEFLAALPVPDIVAASTSPNTDPVLHPWVAGRRLGCVVPIESMLSVSSSSSSSSSRFDGSSLSSIPWLGDTRAALSATVSTVTDVDVVAGSLPSRERGVVVLDDITRLQDTPPFPDRLRFKDHLLVYPELLTTATSDYLARYQRHTVLCASIASGTNVASAARTLKQLLADQLKDVTRVIVLSPERVADTTAALRHAKIGLAATRVACHNPGNPSTACLGLTGLEGSGVSDVRDEIECALANVFVGTAGAVSTNNIAAWRLELGRDPTPVALL